MVITRIDAYRYSLPLKQPLALKKAVLHHREGWLVRMDTENGLVGWGEVAPLPGFSRERHEEAAASLRELPARVVGRSLSDAWLEPASAAAHELDRMALPPSVRFGLETAVWEVLAVSKGVPLPEVLTPHPRALLSVNGLLTGTTDAVLAEAERLREAGYRTVKLKVGRRALKEEVALVRRLPDVLGPEVRLRLDANRAWSLDEALTFARGIEGVPCEYVEEPLSDPAGLPAFALESRIPVALDESLRDVGPEGLGDHGYARAVVLKPTVLGGIVPALRLARVALSLGMTPVVSSGFETGVGTLRLMALAVSLGSADVPAGLDTYQWLGEDVIEPRPAWRGGLIDVEALMKVAFEIRRDVLRHTPAVF